MNILIIGEACVDVYNIGSCDRICPEAPVPVFKLETVEQIAGMAGNVLNNVQSIKPEWSSSAIIPQTAPIKNRFVDKSSGQLLLRVDTNDNTEQLVLDAAVANKIFESDAVIVSDYNKGFISQEQLIQISQLCFEKDIPCFLDTKKTGGLWADLFTFIKINKKEFFENGWSEWASKSTNLANKLIVTQGSSGCRFRGEDYPTENVAIRDVTGAGDTFLAAFAVKYLETKDPKISIDFAQSCCRVVVQKLGTTTPYDIPTESTD